MKGKRRTSIWVNPTLVLQMQAKGIDISSFVNRAMALFLEVPEDPREILIKQQTEYVVTQLRATYMHEMNTILKQHNEQQQVQDLERARADQRSAELLSFGELLQKTTCWKQIRRALLDKNHDSNYWDLALDEMNKMDGDRWDGITLWNTAIDWYAKFGKLQRSSA